MRIQFHNIQVPLKGCIKMSGLHYMIRKDKKVLLVGDFNCKGVNWKEMEESGNAGIME